MLRGIFSDARRAAGGTKKQVRANYTLAIETP